MTDRPTDPLARLNRTLAMSILQERARAELARKARCPHISGWTLLYGAPRLPLQPLQYECDACHARGTPGDLRGEAVPSGTACLAALVADTTAAWARGDASGVGGVSGTCPVCGALIGDPQKHAWYQPNG